MTDFEPLITQVGIVVTSIICIISLYYIITGNHSVRDSRRDSPYYNALRDAHDIAVNENLPSGGLILAFISFTVSATVLFYLVGRL